MQTKVASDADKPDEKVLEPTLPTYAVRYQWWNFTNSCEDDCSNSDDDDDESNYV